MKLYLEAPLLEQPHGSEQEVYHPTWKTQQYLQKPESPPSFF